ncbi:hypothetical protein ES332_D10G084100v1 [Gossypium tomentosum]|uniref:Uncharacterized protein n=1 Tax=Gossypium tomentosum TaxID=34277 RepID=A0A5D2J1E8_GOSTO|nr:hypothetical protein ES332_D10G084100v1 [Gossypium tomentosum]
MSSLQFYSHLCNSSFLTSILEILSNSCQQQIPLLLGNATLTIYKFDSFFKFNGTNSYFHHFDKKDHESFILHLWKQL